MSQRAAAPRSRRCCPVRIRRVRAPPSGATRRRTARAGHTRDLQWNFLQDVTDPRHPRGRLHRGQHIELARDAHLDHYAYIVPKALARTGPKGMQSSICPSHASRGSWEPTTRRSRSTHHLGIYEVSIINGSSTLFGSGGMRILDLADPLHPVDVGPTLALRARRLRSHAADTCASSQGIGDRRPARKAHPSS